MTKYIIVKVEVREDQTEGQALMNVRAALNYWSTKVVKQEQVKVTRVSK